MKIRKANILNKDQMITDVYLHENKKEFHTLVAVPQLEWSKLISYEEEKESSPKSLTGHCRKWLKRMRPRSCPKDCTMGDRNVARAHARCFHGHTDKKTQLKTSCQQDKLEGLRRERPINGSIFTAGNVWTTRNEAG